MGMGATSGVTAAGGRSCCAPAHDRGRRGRWPHAHLPGEVAGARAREDGRDSARVAQEGRHQPGDPPPGIGQYFEELTGRKFDIAAAWWSVTVDPDLFYYPMQHSSSAWNFTGFKNPDGDKRLDAFRFTADPAARKKMYPEMMRFLQEEGSLLVSNEIQRYWTKPNVQGVVPLSSLEVRLQNVWMA